MNIHVIVLAAGNSKRFGGNKLLCPYRGKPVYRYLLDLLKEAEESVESGKSRTGGFGEKILVSQYEEILKAGKSYGYTCLYNEHPEKGISLSIRMGLAKVMASPRYEKGDAAMFCVCDQPELTAKTVKKLMDRFRESGKGIGCVKSGDMMGNPVIFRDHYWEELRNLSGDEGGKIIRRRHETDVVSQEAEGRKELRDIDYTEDLKPLVIVRGGGDLATGTVHRLFREGYRLLVLETEAPACIRRQVSFCEAVYQGVAVVDGVTAVKAESRKEMESIWKSGRIPVAVDGEGRWIRKLKPEVVIDAILAKKNMGTSRDMADLTIALGPGFTAGADVHVVIETMRGASLGKIYRDGSAIPNTGIPGVIAGYGKERVIHAPGSGRFLPERAIGDRVEKGDVLGWIVPEETEGKTPVSAPIPGYVRGMIKEGYLVKMGLKIMDIEPRTEDREICFHISDKAERIGESVYQVMKAYEESQTQGQRV